LRSHLQGAIPHDWVEIRPDVDQLRANLLGPEVLALSANLGGRPVRRPEWLTASAVPTLLQLLQAENTAVRRFLIEVLGQIPDERATAALAVRAMVDLSSEVRATAVAALRQRPRAPARALFLAGLRYPWPPVAAHAAEALVALKDEAAVPHLVGLLEMPDPVLPLRDETPEGPAPVVRELVRVNHLQNCVLCHAPSRDRNDLVRGAVPTPGQPLPPPAAANEYYQSAPPSSGPTSHTSGRTFRSCSRWPGQAPGPLTSATTTLSGCAAWGPKSGRPTERAQANTAKRSCSRCVS
jgi:hypothetical protein